MKITDLKPTIVWKFFHQVTQVPRPSKKEGKMIEFLESFAKEYKIATVSYTHLTLPTTERV